MESHAIEELLAHKTWLDRLAVRLVRDPSTASDLVQETWLTAMRKPPSKGRPARPWLARVLHNLARNRGRAVRRRRDHELAGLAGEPDVPEPATLVAEAELQRWIALAVTRLEEEDRTLVVLAYYRGQSSRQIGRRLDLPASTVRNRLGRALERLRGDLDREHGGRSAGAGGLVAAGGGAGRTSASSGAPTAMESAHATGLGARAALHRSPLRLTLGAAALVALGVVVLRPLLTESAVSGGAELADARGPSHVTGAATPSAAPEASAGSTSSPSLPEASPGAVGATAALSQADRPVQVRGRMLLPDGAPAADLTLELTGFLSQEAAAELHGLPDAWEDRSVSTDAKGCFSLEFVAPRAFQFVLAGKRPGFAPERFRWSRLRPGRVVDLGDVTLRPGGHVSGSLTDAAGAPLTGVAWTVRAEETHPVGPEGRRAVRLRADVDPGTARFELRDLPGGEVQLRARSALGGWVDGPAVLVVPEQEVAAVFVIDDLGLPRRIVVHVENALFGGFRPPATTRVRLIDAGPEPLVATRVDPGAPLDLGGAARFVFDDLEPGAYTVEIDDPRYETWRRESVPSGTAARARVVGSAAIALSSLAPSDVEAIEVVEVECLSLTGHPRTFRVPRGHELFAEGELRGLIPGSYRLRWVAGTRSASAEVIGLQAAEVRLVDATLAEPETDPETLAITGHLFGSDGRPAVDVDVYLLTPAAIDDSARSPVLYPGVVVLPDTHVRKVVGATRTDAAGGFRLVPESPGAYVVHARPTGTTTASSPVLQLEAGAPPLEPIQLSLPAEVALSGRVVGPPGIPIEGLRVLAIAGNATLRELMRGGGLAWMSGERLLDAEGRFRVDGMPSGPVQVHLLLPTTPRQGSGRGSSMTNDSLHLDTFELAPSAAERVFSLDDGYPGVAEVTVLTSGAPLARVTVVLTDETGERRRRRTGVTASGTGTARLVEFSGPRGLEVRDDERGWRYRVPEPLVVPPAGVVTRLVDVPLATAELVVEIEGAAAPGAAVQLAFPEGRWAGQIGGPRVTGPGGRLEVVSPAMSFDVHLLTRDASDAAAVQEGRRRYRHGDATLPRAHVDWGPAGATVRF